MKFKGIPYKRINIRISKSLAKKLETKAAEEFITKSEIVRNWINEDVTLHIKSSFETNIDDTNFNFRLDFETLKRLDKVCSFNEVSKSSYIRLLIINKLTPLDVKQDVPQEALLKNSNSYEVKRYLENKNNPVTNTELIELLGINTDLGFITDAISVFDEYEWRKNKHLVNEEVQISAELTKIKIDLFAKCPADMINKLEFLNKRALLLQNRKILGNINLLKGEYYRYQSQLDKSNFYYHHALEYLDIIHHPKEITEIYLRIAAYYMYQSDLKLGNEFLDRAAMLLTRTNNDYHLVHLLNVRSILNSFNNVLDSVELSKKSLGINKKIKFIRGDIYDCENLVRYYVNLRRYDNAYKLVEEARNNLKFIKIDFDFVQLELCKSFIESFSKYKDSVNQINTLKNSGIKNIRVLSCEYVLNSIKYINGNCPYDKQSSEIYLKRTMAEGAYPLLQKAAQYTLENRNLYLYF